MKQYCSTTLSLPSILAFCVVSLALQGVNGEEPGTDSPAEAKARQAILDSPRWARAKQGFDEWLAVQRVYSDAQVQALESELRNRIAIMSASELQAFLQEMEAKIAVLMSPASMDARSWAAKFTDSALQRKRKQYGVEDPLKMPAAAIAAALRQFAADRQTNLAESAAFRRSRESQARAAQSYHQAQAKIAASPSRAASFGAKSSSAYAPRSNRSRVQVYPRGRYSVGPWGGYRGW